ncbi:MAG: tRNA uridine-5-carboxymethylaminomethyl(34) synthesis enzyme MnmG [Oscillospiraceae bacterium]
MGYMAESIDCAVIGGGHAGIEAALACSRMGLRTVLFSMSLDFIGNLPCNPSIGGTAKGHLVREIDALGGEMGRAADYSFLQSRMLNKGKGPAVHSLRVQADRARYHTYMKKVLENQKNLSLKQGEIVEIRVDARGAVESVVTALGALYPCKAVILCTGTFLNGTVYVGDITYSSGPDGLHASNRLTESLKKLGIPLRRFKTGTPARVHRDSIDFSKLERQDGDNPVVPFSFGTTEPLFNSLSCYVAYTNTETHRVIQENLHRSLYYSGQKDWVGPRYCPSIEDKVVRFPDKERHQIFVEPMGMDTKEMYLQGLSTSLPEDVQVKAYRTLEGFERVEIMRNAYAIEYDCMDPMDLLPTLESKAVPGLYGAGQINGTSGYEEAAGQGLLAGINAVLKIRGEDPLILDRSTAYIGTLIDDLVSKGCNEPYRMMTSRSEYRLLLRQDNADVRLTPIGRSLGLISDERWDMFHVKQSAVEIERKRLEQVNVAPSPTLNDLLEEMGTAQLSTGCKLVDLIRRPQLSYDKLAQFDAGRPDVARDVSEQVEIEIKYEGYIEKQLQQVEQMKRLENRELPNMVDYSLINGLRLEAKEKLSRVQPLNVGQASRISGVSPADISVLLIYLEQQKRKEEHNGVIEGDGK